MCVHRYIYIYIYVCVCVCIHDLSAQVGCDIVHCLTGLNLEFPFSYIYIYIYICVCVCVCVCVHAEFAICIKSAQYRANIFM